ncbi:hypothetical protein IGJ74_000819 [Enterococcus sp. AZ009]|uniref:LPXTG cell wall anchor domain-containing protein n=1 Tax=Enterococcus TaxID=1350 RepID=UPI001C4828F8|nr:LPXTG cell wall anchor domain-containing protein [Enterococcus casseliflavus]
MKNSLRIAKGIIGILCVFILINTPIYGYAQEARSVETEGSISFTGSWPLDPPNPTPPSGPDRGPDLNANPSTPGSRPRGRLPQTNDVAQFWLIYLGIGLIFFVLWKKKKNSQGDEN